MLHRFGDQPGFDDISMIFQIKDHQRKSIRVPFFKLPFVDTNAFRDYSPRHLNARQRVKAQRPKTKHLIFWPVYNPAFASVHQRDITIVVNNCKMVSMQPTLFRLFQTSNPKRETSSSGAKEKNTIRPASEFFELHQLLLFSFSAFQFQNRQGDWIRRINN
ncbi:hypothetical protein OK016_05345 [Vibrio chagasii]|nr:hypothetical protein [Vibrio chagasii]